MAVSDSGVYIVDGLRTPFTQFDGPLGKLTPTELALSCSKALIQKVAFNTKDIDHTVFANVLPVVPEVAYASRHIGLGVGAPVESGGYNINRLCGSGIQALIEAHFLIISGRASTVLCTGAETMSLAPHLIYDFRFGKKFGDFKARDQLLETLTDKYVNTPMGITAENIAKKYSLSREESDLYSLNSHQKALIARHNKEIAEEISPVAVGNKEITLDGHVREEASLEALSKLSPSFLKGGVVTPGSSSGIVDGAASLLVASGSYLRENSISPLGEIADFEVVGLDPTYMGLGPIYAIQRLLSRNKMSVETVDLFEINEAFAPQVMACQRELKIPDEKLNIWGGAIAFGHPLGATGLKITLTLLRQLKLKNKQVGVASACIGGGQGIAILVRRGQE